MDDIKSLSESETDLLRLTLCREGVESLNM